jgi:hypothetical protein
MICIRFDSERQNERRRKPDDRARVVVVLVALMV